jgi:hypothetical protein
MQPLSPGEDSNPGFPEYVALYNPVVHDFALVLFIVSLTTCTALALTSGSLQYKEHRSGARIVINCRMSAVTFRWCECKHVPCEGKEDIVTNDVSARTYGLSTVLISITACKHAVVVYVQFVSVYLICTHTK